ncbi:hypothetical protein NNJEOMEG_03328 [Fundidesulfovibrio magnetotacticus]|uniref:Uncharacterized protein n=1 Tax=Fundidesulfovibrio magnetotacticus TaxID=2730080 RepID=A0A6V8M4S4_9BACT|nr:hypothetical protein [Fundidesulfovibrio magnetotacticus]GFK95465.1 hypothetical protein NNJEOMEG_03328 [Fundidesulfovibrio magnetotacticus]
MPTRTASDTAAGAMSPEALDQAWTGRHGVHAVVASRPNLEAAFWERLGLMRMDAVQPEPEGRFEAMYPEGGEPS